MGRRQAIEDSGEKALALRLRMVLALADLRSVTAFHEAGHAVFAVAAGFTVEHVAFNLELDAARFGETKSIVGGPGPEAFYLDIGAIINAAGLVEEHYRDGWEPHEGYREADIRCTRAMLRKVGCHDAFVSVYLSHVDDVTRRMIRQPFVVDAIRSVGLAFEREIGNDVCRRIPGERAEGLTRAGAAESVRKSLKDQPDAELNGMYRLRQWPW